MKGFTKRREGVREDLRGTYGGLASEDAIAYLTVARRDRGRAAAGAPHRRRELPRRPRPDELLGLLDDRLPRAALALRRDRRPGARVQGDGQGAAPRRHRGDPRRRLQPHRRGQPPRADAQLQGVDNQSYYRLMPDDAALLHGLHGHRQHAQPGAPERAAADHGLAALLRHRVPRRRLPLRPRVGARARVLRRRPALGVLRHHPPGPGPLPGEADRRAVGRRAGRLPGRQLPDPLVGVERHLPRHDARLLARARRRSPSSPRASAARPTSTRATGAGRSRRSTSSRRTTASRFATSSRTTSKHNEANGEGNRDGTDDNRSWNCGVEGPTDDPAVNALRARQQRNFLATLLLSQGVPMLLGGDEWGRTQHGNNNAWCQDNELSWFDWDACDDRAARVHAPADRAPAAPSGVPAHTLLRRARASSFPTSGGCAPTAGG